MITFKQYLVLLLIGIILTIPYWTALFTSESADKINLNIYLKVIIYILYGIGFLMICAYGTRALETFPSLSEIKAFLK